MIKGVILAGGNGTRMYPLTRVTNKHLLAIYDKPVIYYAIEKLIDAGVERIMIVTSPTHIGSFAHLLGSGQEFRSPKTGKQIQIVYGIQNQPNGLAYALYIAREYVGNDHCLLYLGDNLFEDDIKKHVAEFKGGMTVFLKKVPNPKQFGIAVFNKRGDFVGVEEKPKRPKTDLAVVGLYIFDKTVFEKIDGQKPSKRGEFEITEPINKYIKEGRAKTIILKKKWFDVGSIDSLLNASIYMRNKSAR